MKTYPMRCKHCGALLDAKRGGWQRFLHGAGSRISCTHCGKSTTRQDAEAMGTCFGGRVDALEGEVCGRIKQLPVIEAKEASRLMGVAEDLLRTIPGMDTLCSYLMHMFRPVVLDQAHGRDTQIAVVGIGGKGGDHSDGGEAAVGVFGMVEDEKGVREWEAMIARVGPSRFVVYASAANEELVGESSRREERGSGGTGEATGTSHGTASAPAPASDAPAATVAG